MSHPPLLTVAIPFYRDTSYLKKAVASVLGQSDGRWQLIVSDGSGNPDQPARAIAAGPGVVYLPSDRPLGIAANWNRCLDATGTDLVTLLHEDDELLPGYVGRMLQAAADYPTAAVLFCEARVVGPAGEGVFSVPDVVKRFLRPNPGRTITLRGETGLRAVMRGDFIMCPTMCFRLSRLGPRRFPDRWAQVLDLSLIADLLLGNDQLVGIPDVLYAYRRHAANTTAVQTRTLVRFREEAAIHDEVARRAAARGWHRAAGVSQGKLLVKLNVVYCLARDLLRSRCRDARAKAALLAELLSL